METLDFLNSKVSTLDSLVAGKDITIDEKRYLASVLFARWLRVPPQSFISDGFRPGKDAIILLGSIGVVQFGRIPAKFSGVTSRKDLYIRLCEGIS